MQTLNHSCQYFIHDLRSTACLIVFASAAFAEGNELGTEPSPNEIAPTEQLTPTQESKENASLSWDETESLKIFELAQKLLAQENTKGALREFSEIVEFFPNTSIWPKACLQVYYIHLNNMHSDSAKQVLTRLIEKSNLPANLTMELLFAQWDFYQQNKDHAQLNDWIAKRSSEEKKKLRTSPDFIQRFKQSLKDPSISTLHLIQLWVNLEPPRPMESFIHLHQPEKGFTFSREQMNVLLTKLLTEFTIGSSNDLISRIMNIMGQNGWGPDAHQCFLNSPQHPELYQMWIRFLLKHQLFSEALSTIDRAIANATSETKPLTKHDLSLEIIEANIGLLQWNEVATAVKNEGSWIFSALSYPMALQLMKGLHQKVHLKLQVEDVYLLMNPELRNMIQVELEEHDETREKKLLELLANHSLYGVRSAELLNTMYVVQRDQNKLSALLQKLEQSHPQAKTTLSAIKKSIHTLKELQPSKSPERTDLDKK